MKQGHGSILLEYDVVFVGPLAGVVAHFLQNKLPQIRAKSGTQTSSKPSNRLLLISRPSRTVIPALLPSHDPTISIKNEPIKGVDRDTSEIYRIMPHEQIIVMKEKKYYHYRYLVYGETEDQWADLAMIPNLKSALSS